MKKELLDAMTLLDTLTDPTTFVTAAAVALPPLDEPFVGVVEQLEAAKQKRLEGYRALQEVVRDLTDG